MFIGPRTYVHKSTNIGLVNFPEIAWQIFAGCRLNRRHSKTELLVKFARIILNGLPCRTESFDNTSHLQSPDSAISLKRFRQALAYHGMREGVGHQMQVEHVAHYPDIGAVYYIMKASVVIDADAASRQYIWNNTLWTAFMVYLAARGLGQTLMLRKSVYNRVPHPAPSQNADK